MLCTDEVGVLLPVGRMISLFSWESRAMSFVSEGERGDLALALALAPSKKHVAVCERGEHAQVSLYHVASQRRQKTLSCSDVASRDYVSAAFSPDSKRLLQVGTTPNKNIPRVIEAIAGMDVTLVIVGAPDDPTVAEFTKTLFWAFLTVVWVTSYMGISQGLFCTFFKILLILKQV